MTLVDSLSHQVPSQTNLSQVHGVSPSGAPRGDRFVTLSAGARAIAAPAVATLARLDMAIAAVCAALVRPLQRSDLGVHISSRSDPALACFSADGGAYRLQSRRGGWGAVGPSRQPGASAMGVEGADRPVANVIVIVIVIVVSVIVAA